MVDDMQEQEFGADDALRLTGKSNYESVETLRCVHFSTVCISALFGHQLVFRTLAGLQQH